MQLRSDGPSDTTTWLQFCRRKRKKTQRRIRKRLRLSIVLFFLLLGLSVFCWARIFSFTNYGNLASGPSYASISVASNNYDKRTTEVTMATQQSFLEGGIAGRSTTTITITRTKADGYSKIPQNDTTTMAYQKENLDDRARNRNHYNATFSFCVLLKDDNLILNEWLAYHYHTLNLRHVIVAIDPSNTTSPTSIFQQWRHVFGLQVDEWTDQDYMPEFFLQGKYHKVPSFLPDYIKVNASASRWHVSAGITDTNVIQKDLQKINNHRFRQAVFLHKCIKSLRNYNHHHGRRDHHRSAHHEPPNSRSLWMAHIDTDEYIVINPRIRARSPKALKGIAPSTPHASSILNFLETMFLEYPKRLNRPCLAMPSVLFGAVKDLANLGTKTNIPEGWNMSRFETLRWKYHAAWNDTINGLQKTVMDVTAIPSNDMILHHHAHSIHRPSNNSCGRMTLYPDFDAIRLYPLTVNHYVGSFERYRSRVDVRRNEQVYRTRARVQEGGRDDGWIEGWLESFIATHGHERVSRVLQDYLLGGSQ